MSDAERTLPVSGMKLRGGEEGRYHLLRGTGTLALSGSRATLRILYDPPNSGWLALLGTVLTFGLIQVLLAGRWVPVAAGPGFLPWYLAIRASRQRRVELPLGAGDIAEAVLNPEGTLLAVRVQGQRGGVQLFDGWLGLKLETPAEAAPLLQSLWGDKLRRGAVKKGLSNLVLLAIVLAVFMLALAGLAVSAASNMKRYNSHIKANEARIRALQLQKEAAAAAEGR